MSENVALSKVGKTEFFVVMAPGFYLFTSMSLVAMLLWNARQTPVEAWQQLIQSESTKGVSWPLTIGMVLSSYLLGTFVRQVSVEWVDRLTNPLFKKLPAGEMSGYRNNLRRGYFPYPEMQGWLKKTLGLKVEHCVGEAAHGTYNLWKMELCQFAPEAFAYTQELEDRVRLFSGMFWAGACGTVAGAAMVLIMAMRQSPSGWLLPAISLLAGSAFVSALFGCRIRKVRGDEVSFVYLSREVLHRHLREPKSGEEPSHPRLTRVP